MRVRVLHESMTIGAVGEIVDAPDWFAVRPAVKAGQVEIVKKAAKKRVKKAAKKPAKRGDV